MSLEEYTIMLLFASLLHLFLAVLGWLLRRSPGAVSYAGICFSFKGY
jgi:hypothetical protein